MNTGVNLTSFHSTLVTSVINDTNLNSTTPMFVLKFNTSYNMKIAYCIIGTLGFLWNLFVAGVLMAHRGSPSMAQFQTISAFHVLCQTCVDSVVAVLLLLTTLIEDDRGFVFRPGNVFHQLICRVWFSKILLWSALTCSVFSVLTLNFERYLAVVHPIYHKTVYSQKKVYSRLLVSVVFLLGTSYKCSYAVLSSAVLDDGRCTVYTNYPSGAYRSFVSIFTMIFEYLTPLVVMVCFYVRMALVMHRKISPNVVRAAASKMDSATEESSRKQEDGQIFQISREETSAAGSNPNVVSSIEANRILPSQKSDDFVRARNSILKTSFLLSVSFVVCWTSNEFYYLLIQFGHLLGGFHHFYQFSVLMVFLNCCINPGIYCLKYRQFQANFKRLIKNCNKCK